jgi:L-aminopeptidase/D-esterase-like protein
MNRPLLVDHARPMRRLFSAVLESVAEAVLRALWRAQTVVGRDGHALYAPPLEEVAGLFSVSGWTEEGTA